MKQIIGLLLGCFLGSGLTLWSNDSVSIACSKDNTIIQAASGTLGNSKGPLSVGRTNQDGTSEAVSSIRRALVYFDVASNVPSGATIDSVRLSLYFYNTPSGGCLLSIHNVLSDWGEGTSFYDGGQGVSASSNDVTWLHSVYNSVFWKTPGGDFSENIAASATVGSVQDYGIKSWSSDSMKNQVIRWVAHPQQNFGWLIKGDESTGKTIKQFLSRENGNSEKCPTLKVYYTQRVTPGKVDTLTSTSSNELRDNQLKVYPNPANCQVVISDKSSLGKPFVIFNCMGTVVKQGLLRTECQYVDVSDLQSGVYVVKTPTRSSIFIVKK